MPSHGIGPNSTGTDGRARFRDADLISNGGMTYNTQTDTYTARFDHVSASIAVAEGIADVRNCGVTDLDPLYDTLEPDALDRLVDSAPDSFTVSFTYAGVDVLVTGDRFLEIDVPADATL